MRRREREIVKTWKEGKRGDSPRDDDVMIRIAIGVQIDHLPQGIGLAGDSGEYITTVVLSVVRIRSYGLAILISCRILAFGHEKKHPPGCLLI